MDGLAHNKVHKKSVGYPIVLIPIAILLASFIAFVNIIAIFIAFMFYVVITIKNDLVSLIALIFVSIMIFVLIILLMGINIIYISLLIRKYIIKSKKVELFNASISGDIQTFTSHYDKKYLNIIDNYGWTLLHYSAFYNRLNIVKFLLSEGIEKTRLSNNGHTPLDLAYYKNNEEIYRTLNNGSRFDREQPSNVRRYLQPV